MAKARTVVTGIRAIDRKLAMLPIRVQGKVVRPAIRGGMRLVLAEAKAQVPVDTGLTRKNVKLHVTPRKKIGKGRRGSTISMEVVVEGDAGLKKKSKRTGKAYFYPALVQYGSLDRGANPFMSRAYNRAGEPARRTTIDLLKSGVNREIRSL